MIMIVCICKDGKVVIGGDGQVILGNCVEKGIVCKVCCLYKDKVVIGFVGLIVDVFILCDLFEKKLELY